MAFRSASSSGGTGGPTVGPADFGGTICGRSKEELCAPEDTNPDKGPPLLPPEGRCLLIPS